MARSPCMEEGKQDSDKRKAENQGRRILSFSNKAITMPGARLNQGIFSEDARTLYMNGRKGYVIIAEYHCSGKTCTKFAAQCISK